MSIIFKNGDLFTERAEAIVNTVNCVGVMGKGVALEFKRRWPENFKAYKKLCDQKLLKTGEMFIYELPSLLTHSNPQYLINFPTKQHWRGKSELSYIVDGLDDLVQKIKILKIKSIALPPLGCGNGGLEWDSVKPIIESKLGNIDGVDVIVLNPKEASRPAEFVSFSINRKMTKERAILVKTFTEMEPYFGGHLSRLTTQKITYFLQALGINFNLEFSRNLFGPYSETLRKALISMDSQGFIEGFTSDERIITVPASAYSQAEEFLSTKYADADSIIERLGLLIEGFESPYGMELLSTVHYLAHKEGCKPVEKIIEAMAKWSERKRTMFSEESIRSAYSRLVADKLVI